MNRRLEWEAGFLKEMGYTHIDPPPSPARAENAGVEMSAIERLESEASKCVRCSLSETRKTVVFGSGNPNADLMFVGEAPGRDEDEQGLPFVGRAGKLLTDIIGAMTLDRDQVYIANVIKCRPPGNRNPQEEEIAECRPYVLRQIELIRPKVIVTLGKFGFQSLVGTNEAISRARGRWQKFGDADLMPTYHPAYLLRNPSAKKDVWNDMKLVMERLGLQRE